MLTARIVKGVLFGTMWLWFSLCLPHAAAQTSDPGAQCAYSDLILHRYIDAIGGEEAIRRMQTRAADADETEPYSFKPQETATYKYHFEWKAPNKTVSRSTHVERIGGVMEPFMKTHFIFDGERWSDFEGKLLPPQANQVSFRERLVFPYPFYAMLRVASDPLMVARPNDLYSGFTPANDVTDPGHCVLEAKGIDGRVDLLYFDATTGLLTTWKLQIYQPGHSTYIVFRFDDYRPAGEVKFPLHLYCDVFKADFRYTQVIHNRPLPDEHFVIQPR
jgi:hypothetical protein